jgi:hypothetical protein
MNFTSPSCLPHSYASGQSARRLSVKYRKVSKVYVAAVMDLVKGLKWLISIKRELYLPQKCQLMAVSLNTEASEHC